MEATTLGGRLKYVRDKRLGVSQHLLAKMVKREGVGATGPTVLRYEKDQRLAPAAYVRVVAVLGGVDPGWLLTGDGSPDRKPADVSQRAFEEIAAVVDRYRTPVVSSDPEREAARQGDAAFDQNGRAGGGGKKQTQRERKRPPRSGGKEPPGPSKD